ncbi:MAG: methyltransferase domain-containing protein [Acidobacteriota bacterium]|nr:methyltransferase domain-containing protein [Acidobacteriota bacterium]
MSRAEGGRGLFFREFLNHAYATGALMPSGPRLAKALSRYVGESDTTRRILEVGPGTGSVTRHIVRRMAAADHLDLVEINESFIKRLLHDLKHDLVLKPAAERISLLQIPFEQFDGDRRYDIIISGLPMNNFSSELVESIFGRFRAMLAPEGTLSFFEYIAVRRAKAVISGRSQRRRLREIKAVLSCLVEAHEIRRDTVLANIPPAWVHHVRFSQTKMSGFPKTMV